MLIDVVWNMYVESNMMLHAWTVAMRHFGLKNGTQIALIPNFPTAFDLNTRPIWYNSAYQGNVTWVHVAPALLSIGTQGQRVTWMDISTQQQCV